MRRFRGTLTTALLTAVLAGGTAGPASANAQSPPIGPLPGTAAWLTDDFTGKEPPDPATAGPREVAAFFTGLTSAQQRRIVRNHPAVVGNLDGAPVNLRYQANAHAGDQVLAYDPRGRGLIAQVAGDLENAAHVAVIVPGSDTDLATFDATARQAAVLQGEAGDDTAVIAWAGYTTPSGIGLDLATGRLAETGAERLARFTDGLDAAGLPDPSLFCHSYGSVVCGLAASDTDASDIVVMGSPGMRADGVTALGTGARIWAAKSPKDWIDRVPNVEVLGLGHGTDPTSPGFGATVLPADDVPAHDDYLAPGTSALAAFAAIARGDLR
ncbi:alpha/beta hydrolase [Streptomyces chitinivorans]|uniref:Alpha/beta hydrolase n=1 Tax=Streptomyces chitinivorans TaxID=1257027 RepID=A0ABW7HQ56_9ACTN|nr:alpha/beta hydrolase [Streptomyces chitinivorans]MDH2411265.1 alpha/beta hydrolase [Streptomyces chitinivorans]